MIKALKLFLLSFLVFLAAEKTRAQSDFHNYYAGAGLSFEKHTLDTFNFYGFGPAIHLDYFPIDKDGLGLGIGVNPVGLLGFATNGAIALRSNLSLRLLGKNRDILPFGLEYKAGLQRLAVGSSIFRKSKLMNYGSYSELSLLIPIPETGGYVFVGARGSTGEGYNGAGYFFGFSTILGKTADEETEEWYTD